MDLNLPQIPKSCYHKEYANRLVALALGETLLASCYPCLTHAIDERLTALPSDEIMDAIVGHDQDEFRCEVVNDITNIKSAHNWFAWPTMQSRLLEKRSAGSSAFLERMANEPPNRPKRSKFVKEHMARMLCQPSSDMQLCKTDCLDESPRECQTCWAVQKIRQTEDPVLIQEIARSLKGPDCVPPDTRTLALGAQHKMKLALLAPVTTDVWESTWNEKLLMLCPRPSVLRNGGMMS